MKIEKSVRELIETFNLEICIRFRKENQDQIKKSRIKLSRDEELIEELIEMEKEEAERMRQEVLQEQQQVHCCQYSVLEIRLVRQTFIAIV